MRPHTFQGSNSVEPSWLRVQLDLSNYRQTMEATEAVSVTNLTYSYHPGSPPSLLDINLNLPRGSRTLIVGANGGDSVSITPRYSSHLRVRYVAGKSTLLQILAGKRLVSIDGADIRIKGRDVFRDSPPGVTYLGTEWYAHMTASTSPCRSDSFSVGP